MCAFNSSCAPRALASLSRIAALLSGALGVSAAFCAAISAATLAPALAQPASTTKTRSEIVMEDQSRVFKGAEMKRQQLVEAQQELERRTARLKRLESEVIRRYKALRLVQDELNGALKRARAAEEEEGGGEGQSASAEQKRRERAQEIARLSQQYEKMKPADAAGVIEVLVKTDEDLAVDILKAIKPNKAGKILGSLKPEIAAQLSGQMAAVRRGRRGG